MSDVNKANAILAKACGVRLCPSGRCYFTKIEINPSGEAYWEHPFTIEDARCRQVVRERFKVTTWYSDNGRWNCTQSFYANDEHMPNHEAETIAEAEIACLLAIADELGDTHE